MIRLRFWIEPPKPLDGQFAELIEAVWAAETIWRLEDRIEAAIRFGHKPLVRSNFRLRSTKADG